MTVGVQYKARAHTVLGVFRLPTINGGITYRDIACESKLLRKKIMAKKVTGEEHIGGESNIIHH